MRSTIQVLLFILLSGFLQKSQTPAKEWSFSNHVGLAVVNSAKTCLNVQNPSLPPGTEIRLVVTSPPQTESHAQVTKVDTSCPSGDQSVQRYELRGDFSGIIPAMPVIALVGFSGKFKRRGELISADLDGDGTDEYFRSCTSTEGIHFTIWSGKPLSGKLRWHTYYYLGYDVSPTCTDKETDSPR